MYPAVNTLAPKHGEVIDGVVVGLSVQIHTAVKVKSRQVEERDAECLSTASGVLPFKMSFDNILRNSSLCSNHCQKAHSYSLSLVCVTIGN